jgi:hypothetical protein
MSAQDVLTHFGPYYLARWDRAALSGVNITEAAKTFLTEIGLPSLEGLTLEWQNSSPTVPRVKGAPQLRVIGGDDENPICIDEASGGRVVILDEDDPGRRTFLNRGVEELGRFLLLYDRWAGSPEPSEALLDEAEQQMRGIDPEAFADASNWWPRVIAGDHDYYYL